MHAGCVEFFTIQSRAVTFPRRSQNKTEEAFLKIPNMMKINMPQMCFTLGRTVAAVCDPTLASSNGD